MAMERVLSNMLLRGKSSKDLNAAQLAR